MTNYREILRLHSLGLSKTEIASSCQCARNTVAATLQRAANCGLQWPLPDGMSDKQLSERLFPSSTAKPVFKMPDYAYVHNKLSERRNLPPFYVKRVFPLSPLRQLLKPGNSALHRCSNSALHRCGCPFIAAALLTTPRFIRYNVSNEALKRLCSSRSRIVPKNAVCASEGAKDRRCRSGVGFFRAFSDAASEGKCSHERP